MNKDEILAAIGEGIQKKIVTPEEVRALVARFSDSPNIDQAPSQSGSRKHLNAVDTMFYIGGLILFASLMTLVTQSWDDDGNATQIFLTAGVGSLLWIAAWVLKNKPEVSDVRDGLANSMILTGSLAIIAGGYIILNEFIDDYNEINLIGGAIVALILAMIHYAYDKLVHNLISIIMSAILTVMFFPLLFFGILGESVGPDLVGVVTIASAVMLSRMGRVIAKTGKDRTHLASSFDGLASLVGIGTIYILTFSSEAPGLWQIAMVIALLGAFYLSIVRQSRDFLNVASIFLVIYVLTISFTYFSGSGPVVSLALAAFGVIGTAMVASNINKKYIKK